MSISDINFEKIFLAGSEESASTESAYIIGILREKNGDEFSPILSLVFSKVCEKKGDTLRAFDYSLKALKNRNLSEKECEEIRNRISRLSSSDVINRFTDYNGKKVGEMFIQLWEKRRLNSPKKITVTMTSCKRYDLFKKTVTSFLNCCEDSHLIDEWIVVDDNSDILDRSLALAEFPFINFVWKGPEDKGHPRSMNIIKNSVKTPFIFHIEDDWIFYRREKYLSICLDILESDPSYGQCLLNRSYGERPQCVDILCPGEMKFSSSFNRYYEHIFYGPDDKRIQSVIGKKNCTYWPHYSLRVGMTRMDVINHVGQFNESGHHFEAEYAYRFMQSGYKTVFMDSLFCYHSGRCTFERKTGLKNAYDLNSEIQFEKKSEPEPESSSGSSEKYRVKTLVINLEKRCDRLKNFMQENGEKLSVLQVNVFKAIDGRTLNPLPKTLKLFETGDYKYRKGIVGCASSHLKIWHELSLSDDIDIKIIFEDDVTLCDKILDKIVNALRQLPANNWDVLFLGHSLYSRFLSERDREDKEPVVSLWSREQSIEKSMGGLFGYVIHKRGAKKMIEHIAEKGIYNAIDWVVFKNEKMKLFYCYPHLVFSEYVTPYNLVDSDIQFDKSSLCESMEKRLDLEKGYWKGKGIDAVVVDESNIPDKDSLLTNVFFIKTNDYLRLIQSLQYLPLEFYTLKGEYVVCIPHTKIDVSVKREVVLDGGYINLKEPV
jgi:GR25 family glycosyltransferase involved in LPS biosynthesis